MKFIRVNEKRYDVKEVKEELYKVWSWVNSFYNEGFQESLIYDLVLRNLAYVISSEFIKDKNTIDNKLDLVNLYIDHNELMVQGISIANEMMVVSIGFYRDAGVDGEIKTKIVFGRC